MSATPGSLYRKEDVRLVRGAGLFTDDVVGPGLLHLHIVRSPYAHARILGIDTSAAEALPGVVCTLTGREIAAACDPYMQIAPPPASAIVDYPMAVDRVRYQGEPVAAVVAETAALAADGGERIRVEYEILEPVLDVETALKDKIVLHEAAGTNRTWREPSWLVMDMPAVDFDALSRRYGQLATLYWAPDERVRLRVDATKPAGFGPDDDIDWLQSGPGPARD